MVAEACSLQQECDHSHPFVMAPNAWMMLLPQLLDHLRQGCHSKHVHASAASERFSEEEGLGELPRSSKPP